jgi:hypothetical protein
MRGVAHVTNVAVGCGGRVVCDGRARAARTAKSRGPGAPTLALSFREASFPGVTVAREPGHRGEREVSRKTTAQGKPACFRLNLWSYPRAFYCTGPMGAIGARLSLRPLQERRANARARLGLIMSRERGRTSQAGFVRRPPSNLRRNGELAWYDRVAGITSHQKARYLTSGKIALSEKCDGLIGASRAVGPVDFTVDQNMTSNGPTRAGTKYFDAGTAFLCSDVTSWPIAWRQ